MRVVFLFFALFWTMLPAQDPSLQLEVKAPQQTDAQGVRYVVTAGQPFQIALTLHDAQRNTGTPSIKGLEGCQVLGTSQSSNMTLHDVNNVRSIRATHTFLYQVVALQQGTLQIGPATVQHAGKKINSEMVTLQVQAAATTAPSGGAQQPTGQQSGAVELVAVRLVSSDQQVVVGQPCVVSILVYSRGPIQQMQLACGSTQGALFKPLSDGQQRQELYQGSQYRVEEKRFLYTPMQTGNLQIDPATVIYTAPAATRRRHSPFGVIDEEFFDHFFGAGGMVQRKAVSEPLLFAVRDLPPAPTGTTVSGVASIEKIDLQLEKMVSNANEPIMLTVRVQAVGDLEQLKAPVLQIPASIKWYESKTTVQPSQDGKDPRLGAKIFEYVLQPTQVGSWQMGIQPFTTYDQVKKKYATVTAAPCTLEVQQMVGAPINVPASDLQQTIFSVDRDVAPTAAALETTSDIHHIMIDWQKDLTIPPNIPWLWFFIACALPFVCVGMGRFFVVVCQRSCKGGIPRFDARFVANMQKKLELMEQSIDACGLHQFFLEFLSAKLQIPIADLSDEDIIQRLGPIGLDAVKADEFVQFLRDCAAVRFGARIPPGSSQHAALLRQAKRWLLLLGA